MKRVLLALAVLAALAPISRAQRLGGSVRGKIVDDKGQGVEGAEIVMDFDGGVTRKFQIKSNKKGEFAQIGLLLGNYKVTISKEGFQSIALTPKIGGGDPTEMGEIKLVSASVALAKQRAAAESQGGNLPAAFKAAYQLLQDGKLDESKHAFEAIAAKQPDIAEVHFNLGYIAAQNKDQAAAEAAYKKSLELKPDFVPAYAELAALYESQGDRPKALELLRKAAVDHPDNGALLFHVGWALFNRGGSAEAKPLLEKARDLQPDNPEVHYLLGTIAVGEGDITKAVASLEKYLSMSPKNAQNIETAQQLILALKPKK